MSERKMVAHFRPYVMVQQREDGRFVMTVDWSDSFDGAEDYDSADAVDDPAFEQGACAAVDAFVEKQPETFLLPEVAACGAIGPREAVSPCVLPVEHYGDHRDEAGGEWLR